MPVPLDLGYFFEQLLAVARHPHAAVLIITEKTVSCIRVVGEGDAVPLLFLRGERTESLLQCVLLYLADEAIPCLCV